MLLNHYLYHRLHWLNKLDSCCTGSNGNDYRHWSRNTTSGCFSDNIVSSAGAYGCRCSKTELFLLHQ